MILRTHKLHKQSHKPNDLILFLIKVLNLDTKKKQKDYPVFIFTQDLDGLASVLFESVNFESQY